MKQPMPATMPMISEPPGRTKPEAGVTATRPATAPEAMPRTDGLPLTTIHSDEHPGQGRRGGGDLGDQHGHARRRPLAVRAEPALKPNQPTHSSEAPISV